MSADGTYNGWANYQTWNVILWLSNDEGLNNFAAQCDDYDHFKESIRDVYAEDEIAFETPDGVAWNDSGVNSQEMAEFWSDNFSQVAY
jgi:hypothetical protein